MRARLTLLVVSIVVLFAATLSWRADVTAQGGKFKKVRPVDHGAAAQQVSGPQLLPAPQRVTMAEYTFDDGVGGPDPQGWETHDLTNADEAFTHIDNFFGLPYGPIQGQQSLWFGRRAQSVCDYTGYGHNWREDFESVDFAVTGTLNINYQIRYDLEPNYDFLRVSYVNNVGDWVELKSYTGAGTQPDVLTIPAGNMGPTTRIRFRVESDQGWDDEDGLWPTNGGAAVLDDLYLYTVSDTIDSQDFESEPLNAQVTSDGDWAVYIPSGYGDFAALYDGMTLVQEDPDTTNDTYVWGFFNGSTADYTCGGYPGQTAVPYGPVDGLYLNNEIRSPVLDLSLDANSMPVPPGTAFTLFFDVYRDLPLDNLVFYVWRVRSLVNGCWEAWQSNNFVYYNSSKTWYEHSEDLSSHIPAGATHIQVGIGARDMCGFWCNIQGSGNCHSHAPLIDNVRVIGLTGGQLVVTNTNDSGPGSLRQAIIEANIGAAMDTISFNIPGGGFQTIQLETELPGVTTPVYIDGTTQPGYAGNPLVLITQHPSFLVPIGLDFAGNADGSILEAIGAEEFADDVISIRADNCVVRSCYIGTDLNGNPSGNFADGIRISGSNNTIGGTSVSTSNLISGNGTGVLIQGLNNRVEQNMIDANTNRGIRITEQSNEVYNNTIQNNAVGCYVQNSFNEFFFNQFISNPSGAVVVTSGTGNVIRENSMSSNGIGIDLGDDDVTSNDIGDGDTGPNNLQNFPIITAAYPATGIVEGEIKDGEPNTQLTIDVYRVNVCNGTGHGEADFHIGEVTVTTNASGDATFFVDTGEIGFPNVSATATDPNGNTSEYSVCYDPGPVIFVTNTNDNGLGSLRKAIDDANNSPGFDVIAFSVPGAGPHTITPLTRLPTITDGVLIDGFSEPGSSPNTNPFGQPSNAVMKIEIDASNYTGLQDGLFLAGDGSTIRGLVVNRAPGAGIAVQAQNCTIEGCYIGTDPTGMIARANVTAGSVDFGAIRLTPGGTFTDPQNLTVGGVFPSSRNVISGNDDVGIYSRAHTSFIYGNYIGVNAAGTSSLPNDEWGILLDEWADNSTIGGSDSGAGNVVSGNAGGIYIASDNNTVYGNLVGPNAPGTSGIGNVNDGVVVALAVTGNVIGGSPAGSGNTIAYNGGDGIQAGSFVGATLLRRNLIYENIGLGIDIDNPGPSPTPASYQDVPVITVVDPLSNTVAGTFTGPASTLMRIELFMSDDCDPSGYGEGQTFLGSFLVSSGFGVGNFNLTPSVPIIGGKFITATAWSNAEGTSEFSLCFEAINTPVGAAIEVDPVDESSGESPLDLTFDNVLSEGNTTLEITSGGPPPPGSFTFGDNTTFYDLSTDASFDSVEVCITYDENDIPGAESDLEMLHYDENTMLWDPITTVLDTVANLLCGRTDSFSLFGIAASAIEPFIDVTAAPLDNGDDGSAVAWSDYDGDGDLDLYVSNAGQANKLFQNTLGVFSDVTPAPLADTGNGNSVAWGDFDNDGDPDLYIAIRTAANKMFRNDGGGTFVDITVAPLDNGGDTRSVTWVDYDNDGDLDLYIVNSAASNLLVRNDGGSWFNDSSAPIDDAGLGRGASWGDYDGDGDQDLFLANNGANKLLRNDGSGTFVDVTSGPLGDTQSTRAGMWGDYDNDGDLDLFLSNNGTSRLIRNDGGVFVEVASATLNVASNHRSADWVDYDRDGDLDIYAVVNGGANNLFRNDGSGIFVDVSNGPIADAGAGSGAAWADFDADGDLDVYVANTGTNALIANDTPAGSHWLHVDLEGQSANRDAVGARVRVVSGGLSQIREITGGAGFLGQGSLTAEFGLGAATYVDTVEVLWPGGDAELRTGIPADQKIFILETLTPSGVDDLPGMPRNFALHQNYPNPFNPTTTIAYDLREATNVTLRIYDVAGRLVRALVEEHESAGRKTVVWDAKNDAGNDVATGVYFYRLAAGDFVQVRKMILMK